jgi:hypothetical protein
MRLNSYKGTRTDYILGAFVGDFWWQFVRRLGVDLGWVWVLVWLVFWIFLVCGQLILG